MLRITPEIVKWYYGKAKTTGQDFFLLPPSGYLYAYPGLMSGDDQARFVQQTEDSARLLNSSGTVDWEFAMIYDLCELP